MAGSDGADGERPAPTVAVELIAVLVAVADGSPLAMTLEDGRALPSGPLQVGHRSLQSGLSAWVERISAPAIAETGVDLISVGWLTHSAPILDIGLEHRG